MSRVSSFTSFSRGRVPQQSLTRLVALLAALFVAAPLAAQNVSIRLDRFGVGSAFRAGEWVAARFAVTLESGEPQAAQLVWEVPNADGDIAEHVRPLVLNPGQPVTLWLSARLVPRTDTGSVFTVRVFADDDGERGQELSSTRISPGSAEAPATLIEDDRSAIVVLGPTRMNLDGYSTQSAQTNPLPRGLHEGTQIVGGLNTRELPDRWEGLLPFEAIVWGDVAPQTLELDESEALREYIRRGGHLVVVLPQAGNPWGLGAAASHQLHDLLPARAPRRVEGVPVAQLMPVLSKLDGLRNSSAKTNLSVFDPATLGSDYEPFMALPARRDSRTGLPVPAAARADQLDGAVVAVQRRLGFGRITVVGIDIASISRLNLQAGGLPQTDAFWNRILGRRGDTPSPEELQVLENAPVRQFTADRLSSNVFGSGETINSFIGMTGQAAFGTLLAIALFALYWFVACPISFYALRGRGQVRHAWMAFVVVGAAFTVAAWLGGTLLRQANVAIKHVTFLDHVARVPGAPPSDEPQFQRALSWFSVYLPSYGSAEVRLVGEPTQRDLLASWAAPGSSEQGFPDRDRYIVDYTDLSRARFPSRATATTLEAHWLGVVDERRFGSLPAASEPIVEQITRDVTGTRVQLSGVLKHGLPASLENVILIHVSSFRTPLRSAAASSGIDSAKPAIPGDIPNFGRIVAIPKWEPGQSLNLREALYRLGPLIIPEPRSMPSSFPRSLAARYTDAVAKLHGGLAEPGLDTDLRRRYFEMLSLFNMLEPPRWLESQPSTVDTAVRFSRRLGRSLDLSPWFTRPCVIIIGHLRDETVPAAGRIPFPVEVNGSEPPSEGWTIVRWICPLPLDGELVIPAPRESSAARPTPPPAPTTP